MRNKLAKGLFILGLVIVSTVLIGKLYKSSIEKKTLEAVSYTHLGECCPVCGSTHHELNKVEKINLEESNEKTTLLESKEEKLKELILEFSKIEATLEYENKKIEELNKTKFIFIF